MNHLPIRPGLSIYHPRYIHYGAVRGLSCSAANRTDGLAVHGAAVQITSLKVLLAITPVSHAAHLGTCEQLISTHSLFSKQQLNVGLQQEVKVGVPKLVHSRKALKHPSTEERVSLICRGTGKQIVHHYYHYYSGHERR